MRIWFAVAGVVLSDAFGNMALRRGMQKMGDVTSCKWREFPALLYRLLRNKLLGVGVFFIALAFLMFLTLLSWTDLSFALPSTALASVVNALGARFILKENVTMTRWIGTLLIFGGVMLLGRN